MASLDSSRTEGATSLTLDVDREVSLMREMSVDRLRTTFAEVFGEATSSRHKAWLIKRIAWRMQANLEGGLSERALARAAELANGTDVRVTPPRKPKAAELGADCAKPASYPASSDDRTPVPGSSLRRKYKGRYVFVRVLQEGFEFEGQVYRSLTAITKAVTGSHWNGYHFFGLTKKGARS